MPGHVVEAESIRVFKSRPGILSIHSYYPGWILSSPGVGNLSPAVIETLLLFSPSERDTV